MPVSARYFTECPVCGTSDYVRRAVELGEYLMECTECQFVWSTESDDENVLMIAKDWPQKGDDNYGIVHLL